MIPALLRRAAVRFAVRPALAGLTDRAVRGITAGLIVAVVGFAVRFGSNAPVGDEWDLVQPVVRDGLRLGWVVEHHNEHRFPLVKLVWAGLLITTGFDFRAGILVSVGVLAAGVVGMLAAARQLRGRLDLADLLLPALLLHWGHWFNLLRGDQLAVTLVIGCAAGILYWAARAEPGQEYRAGLWAGLFLVVMTQNGGFGLGYAGPVALWVAYLAWRRRSFLLLIPPLVAVAYAAFAYLTTPPPLEAFPRPTAAEAAEAFVSYLRHGFGWWMTSAGPAGTVLTLAAHVAAVGCAARAALIHADERPRALGLLAVLAGHLAVAAAVASYRGMYLGDRFVTPSALGLCGCWLALVRYGPRVPGGAVVGLAAAVALYAGNAGPGYRSGMQTRAYFNWLLADARAGLPPFALAGKYGHQWLVFDPFGRNAAGLRAGKVGPFAGLPPDPPVRAVRASEATELPAFAGGDPPPGVRLIDPPGPVLGLRVRVRQRASIGWQELALEWPGGRATAYAPLAAGQQSDLVFWVGGRAVTDARLVPACPTPGFDLLAVDWLLPGDRE